jgi:hypothetical protein
MRAALSQNAANSPTEKSPRLVDIWRGGFMAENKGKPSGKYAEDKTDPGRKGDLKRAPWPEEGRDQRDDGNGNAMPGEGSGRNRKAGAP